MGSKPSKEERQSITVATKTATIPVVFIIPTEIIDEILDHLITNSGSGDHSDSLQRSLRSYSLVSKSWVPLCRRYVFHTIVFTSRNVVRWLETFPVPEESLACYVKDLMMSLVWRTLRRSRGVFQAYPVVYERGEYVREGERGGSVARDIFVCEVAAVCDIVDH